MIERGPRDVVASFFVARKHKHLRADCGASVPIPPTPARYLEMLKVLDRSCQRLGFHHVVLTDTTTAEIVAEAGLMPFQAELPRNLMQAVTRIQAIWLASPHSEGCNTTFVGADCIIQDDFRGFVPPSDLAVAYMRGHKKWRLNNGFMHVPAASREAVAPLLRLVADDTGPAMCDDMIALERALQPISGDYGVIHRRGLDVALLPLALWNLTPEHMPDDPIENAFVLHYMGGWEDGKERFFQRARELGLCST